MDKKGVVRQKNYFPEHSFISSFLFALHNCWSCFHHYLKANFGEVWVPVTPGQKESLGLS